MKLKLPAPRAIDLLAVIIIVAAVLWTGAHNPWHTESDPDRFYHLTLARIIAENGFVHELPQVDDLGWAKQFYEKEFLFHALIALGQKLGGEPGAIFAVWLMCAALFLLIYAAARFYTGPPTALFLCALLLFADRQFIRRMFFVRPYVLSLVFFFMLVVALQRKRPGWVFGATFGFALAYHAHYLPILALAVAWWFDRQSRVSKTMLGAGLLGLVVGVVVNPYFPTNIILAYVHIGVALGSHALDKTQLALELMPYDSWLFFMYFGAHLAVLIAALVWCKPSAPRWLIVLTGVFFVLGFRNPRGLEYAAPLATIVAAWLVEQWSQRTRTVVLLLATTAILPRAIKDFGGDQIPATGLSADKLKSAFAIPHDPGKKVFNCDWASGAFVFYARPDMRVVDLIEPVLLLEHDPEKYDARNAFDAGDVADASGLIGGVFGASYVYCRGDKPIAQLDADPAFVRLYPEDPGLDRQKFPVVFAWHPENDEAFVHEITVGSQRKKQVLADGESPVLSRYLDFHGAPPGCTAAHLSDAEKKAHLGAEILTIGGGPEIRVEWNGTPLALALAPAGQPRLIHSLVSLPHALTETDALTVNVCAEKQSPYAGLALGLWKSAALQNICEKKGGVLSEFPQHPSALEHCFGAHWLTDKN